MDNRPIGVFDSGLGGLTVVKSIVENLPGEDIVYFGDTGRVPYGDRSKETLLEYVTQDMDFLLSKNVKAVVIACNTADAMTKYEMQQKYDLPVIGVVEPAALTAAGVTKNGIIGVFGTNATIESRAYEKALGRFLPAGRVVPVACPLLVPLVEDGRTSPDDLVTNTVLEGYIAPVKAAGADTLILGCTHYPLLYDSIARLLSGVNLVCSGFASTEQLIHTLKNSNMLNASEKGTIKYYVSDAPLKFGHNASRFIGREVEASLAVLPG